MIPAPVTVVCTSLGGKLLTLESHRGLAIFAPKTSPKHFFAPTWRCTPRQALADIQSHGLSPCAAWDTQPSTALWTHLSTGWLSQVRHWHLTVFTPRQWGMSISWCQNWCPAHLKALLFLLTTYMHPQEKEGSPSPRKTATTFSYEPHSFLIWSPSQQWYF